MLIFELARKAIKEVMKSAGVKEANERNVKKSALCTTYTISDGDGESENYATCAEMLTWHPVITIYFHNYTDRDKLHKTANDIRNSVIAELLTKTVDGLFDFGSPITWTDISVESEKPYCEITLTAKGIEK